MFFVFYSPASESLWARNSLRCEHRGENMAERSGSPCSQSPLQLDADQWSCSRHESSAMPPIQHRGTAAWAWQCWRLGAEGTEGRCRDTHRPEGWFPGRIQSGPCLLPASSLVPTNSPKLVPPSIPSSHKGFAVSFQHFEKIIQGVFLLRVTGQGREGAGCTRQWSKSGVFLDSTSWHKHEVDFMVLPQPRSPLYRQHCARVFKGSLVPTSVLFDGKPTQKHHSEERTQSETPEFIVHSDFPHEDESRFAGGFKRCSLNAQTV